MDIYVASSWRNQDEVRLMQALLKEAGHLITHDWTKESETPGFLSSQDVHNEYGYNDFIGVVEADAVVVLAHPEAKDTRCEMGMAIGMGKPVIVVGPEKWSTVFMDARLGVYVVPSMQDAVDKLAQFESEWYDIEGTRTLLRIEAKS